MYNDEQNMYRHTYSRGGDEPGQRYDARPSVDQQFQNYYYQSSAPQQPPVQEVKPKKKRTGLKIAALALACALLGGAAGGALMWGVQRGQPSVTALPPKWW